MKVLEAEDLRALLGSNREGVMGPRNQAAIACAALWGVTASELSLIEMEHIANPNGRLKKKWELPATVAFNGHARTLFTEHPSLVDILDAYLNWRVERGWGINEHSRFRGLDPSSKLILNDHGQAFSFSTRSATESGKQPTAMNMLFRKLITHSGIEGVTYGTFRKSFIIHLKRAGLTTRNIMAVTGIRDYGSVSKVVRADPRTVSEAVGGLYDKL